jgi:hypothetical protein
VERYRDRYRIQDVNQRSLLEREKGRATDLLCRTPPPTEGHLQSPSLWRVPEKVLFNLDALIKRSFETGTWRFNGNDLLINSSASDQLEKTSIMTLLTGIDLGCTAITSGSHELGEIHWRQAFDEIDHLVAGQYHDIIPNLILKVTELGHRGFGPAATRMRDRIAQRSKAIEGDGDKPIAAILSQLDEVSLEHMAGLEESIMALFRTVFEFYLGRYCYNSFVTMMDGANGRLRRNEWLSPDDCLPDLAKLDATFGPANCRPLDMLRLRIEISYLRGQYDRVIEESSALIPRAYTKQNDPWQMHYYLFIGWHHRSSAQYHLEEYGSAKESLSIAQYMADRFSVIEPSGLFDPERVYTRKSSSI